MAEAEEVDSLENLLNQATSPLTQDDDDDQDGITRFCEQVNREFDGAHDAVQLLVHKITSPQEKEALLGLTVLEVCVRNCGHKFHAEIGKFRFLNEMIKVISPKYLGSKRSDRVKKKCVELMYCWTKALAHEGKVVEAYQMLKKQGIVKEDPTYMDKACDLIPVPKHRPKKAVFEDEDKSKLLARLLKSKHPEDLQAANRLIKNMVKQDAEKNEKVSRRIRELDNVNNNVKLLVEMLEQYDASTSTDSECDVMKELHDSLEKHRPTLFRLASDADDKDSSAMNRILAANDEVVKVIDKYRSIFGDSIPSANSGNDTKPDRRKDANSLLDLGFDSNNPDKHRSTSSTLVDSELASLGLNDVGSASTNSTNADSNMNNDSLSEFSDLFSSSTTASQNTTFGASTNHSPFHQSSTTSGPGVPSYNNTVTSSYGNNTVTSSFGSNDTDLFGGALSDTTDFTAPTLQSNNASQSLTPGTSNTPTKPAGALADLDFLGQSLLQKSLPPDKAALPFIPSSELNQKPSLNQLKQSQSSTPPQINSLLSTNSLDLPGSGLSAPGPVVHSPNVRLNPSIPGPLTPEMLSLADIFVPIDTIKPASVPSITIYDRNSIKIVIHFGREGPKPHILVMVVSTMSTNPHPVKNFVFQAAVPKLMRVKLQPPSATELPPFNPILPPTAITQVMSLSNPQKEQIRLKYKITYSLNEQPYSDVGDYDKFPVQ